MREKFMPFLETPKSEKTLLDEFAMATLTSIAPLFNKCDYDNNYEKVASVVYKMADAMMEERKKYVE